MVTFDLCLTNQIQLHILDKSIERAKLIVKTINEGLFNEGWRDSEGRRELSGSTKECSCPSLSQHQPLPASPSNKLEVIPPDTSFSLDRRKLFLWLFPGCGHFLLQQEIPGEILFPGGPICLNSVAVKDEDTVCLLTAFAPARQTSILKETKAYWPWESSPPLQVSSLNII